MPYFSSTPSFTMGEREENLVKLLRNVMGLVEGSVDGRSASKYLKKIRELDPSNMFTENAEGVLVRNTFFDICCKVALHSCHTGVCWLSPESQTNPVSIN